MARLPEWQATTIFSAPLVGLQNPYRAKNSRSFLSNAPSNSVSAVHTHWPIFRLDTLKNKVIKANSAYPEY
jgi:hypothetical protein